MKTMHVLLALVASAPALAYTPPLAFRHVSGVPSTFGRSPTDGPRTGATALTMTAIHENFVRGSDDPLMKLCVEEERASGELKAGEAAANIEVRVVTDENFVRGPDDPLMKLCAEEGRASGELKAGEAAAKQQANIEVRGVTRSTIVTALCERSLSAIIPSGL